MTTFAEVLTGPAITDDERDLLAWAADNPTPRPEPERDRWGRYSLPHPETARKTGWTRTTTLVKAIDDTYNLELWAQRMAAVGFATQPALVNQVAEIDDPHGTGKVAVNDLVAEAKRIAGANLSSELGTAMHTATEHHDLGTGATATLPATWHTDLGAYAEAIATAGLTIHPEWIERIVLCPAVGAAGTFDRIVTLPDGRNVILDVKTGRDLSYGWVSIAGQLAVYANAQVLVPLDGGAYEPMPTVDRTVALVAHMPIGTGTCAIYEVDIAKGWELAQLCFEVRNQRKTKNLARSHQPTTLAAAPAAATVEEADPPAAASSTEPTHIAEALEQTLAAMRAAENSATTDRTDWIVARITALKADHPELVEPLRARWLARCNDIARKPPWTDGEIDQLDALLHAIEPTFGAPDPAQPTPTPEPEPAPLPPAALWEPVDDGQLASDEDVTAIRATIAQLRVDHLERFNTMKRWRDDAYSDGRAWSTPAGLTVRQWHVARAVLTCLRCCWDPKLDSAERQTRAVLSIATGEDLDPSWRTGTIFGSLTAAQAEAVCTTANLFASADRATRAAVKSLVAEAA